MEFPMKHYRLSLKIWDKDLISSNDFISEGNINFEKDAILAYDNDTDIAMKEDGKDKMKI